MEDWLEFQELILHGQEEIHMMGMLWHQQPTGRPINPDKARKVEDKCVQTLPEARKLQVIDTSVAKKQAPLTQWMKDVSAHLKSNGMDSVFYAVFYAVKSNQAVDLLNNWSQMDMNEVTEWYKQDQWNNYDKDNLRILGKFL